MNDLNNKFIWHFRNILIGALHICWKLNIKNIVLTGIDFKNREYFYGTHPQKQFHNTQEKYDKLEYHGYSTYKIVEEVITYLINLGYQIYYTDESPFLKNIKGMIKISEINEVIDEYNKQYPFYLFNLKNPSQNNENLIKLENNNNFIQNLINYFHLHQNNMFVDNDGNRVDLNRIWDYPPKTLIKLNGNGKIDISENKNNANIEIYFNENIKISSKNTYWISHTQINKLPKLNKNIKIIWIDNILTGLNINQKKDYIKTHFPEKKNNKLTHILF